MPQGLPISSLVNVSVSLTPPAATGANLDTLLIVGSSDVIDTYQRVRTYSSLSEMAADFLSTSPEYQAAEVYFSQSPQPSSVMIGRWAATATHGRLVGGVLTQQQQNISNWTSITNGSFDATIDGISYTVQNINLSNVTSMYGVASAVQEAINSTPINPPFFGVSLTAQSGGSLAAGTIYVAITHVTAFGETTPSSTSNVSVSAGDEVVVNLTLAPSNPNITGYNVYAGTSATSLTKQNSSVIPFSNNYIISSLSTTGSAPPTTNTAVTPSTAFAKFQFTPYGYFVLISGTTGPNSSVSYVYGGLASQLLISPAEAQYTVAGMDPETPLNAVVAISNLPQFWYGLMFATYSIGSGQPSLSDADALAVAAYIEASGPSNGNPHIFGVTTSEPAALVQSVNTDLGASLQAAGYTRTFAVYSSQSLYAAAAIFGILFTVNFSGTNTMVNVMWKQINGVNYETLTVSEAQSLNSKNYNYYALFNNGVAIVVNGTMASKYYIDEIFGMDALATSIQTNVFNLFATTPTKIPQTDSGVHQIVKVIETTCDQFVVNGFLAPGYWTSAGFGQLQPGQYMSKGYLVYAPPVATQSAALRAQRISPTIQVAAKEAGAINDVVISVGINR